MTVAKLIFLCCVIFSASLSSTKWLYIVVKSLVTCCWGCLWTVTLWVYNFYVTSATNECASYFWTTTFSPNLWFDGRLVLEQTLNSTLPFEQLGLKFCLAWASLRLLCLMKLADDLPMPLCPSDKWEWRATCSAGRSTCPRWPGDFTCCFTSHFPYDLLPFFPVKLEEGRPLPSPSHLKRRIIIKNKKLKPEQECEGEKKINVVYFI